MAKPTAQPQTASEKPAVILSLYHKIAALKMELIPLIKNQENPFHKSMYFDINDILEHLEPLLTKHNLLLTQPIVNGHVVSKIRCLDSGEIDESSLQLPVLADPQKMGSCITYYRRYTVQSQIGLRAVDDDANKASGRAVKDEKIELNSLEKYNLLIGTHERAIHAIRNVPALTTYYNSLSNELKADQNITNFIKKRRTALTPATA